MTMMPNVIQFRKPACAPELRRPAVLVRAAHSGAKSFNRMRELPRLLGCDRLPTPEAALPRLREIEQRLNEMRLECEPNYDLHSHIMVLIAILAESTQIAPVAVTLPGKAIPTHP